MSRRMVTSQLPVSGRSILSHPAQQQQQHLHHEVTLQSTRLSTMRQRVHLLPSRHISSSSPSSASATITPPKPPVLEKPEKFRPPSHPSRLNARRIPRHYAPPLPEAEIQAQSTRQYPHTFPNAGSRMHWFLTNRYVHLWISLGTLFTLSAITLTQSFLSTSPLAPLTPPISRLATSPISFVRDWLAVLRMHQEHESKRTAELRARGIQDAQKRRLYRRAHGMEDVEKEGVGEGVDVRGLVGWDDGLTRGERERLRLGEGGVDEASPVREVEGGGVPLVLDGGVGVGEGESEQQQQQQQQQEFKRQRKPLRKWLGIW